MNEHKNHEIIPIDNDEALKKQNISLDSSIKENNEAMKNIKELKEKLEKEINLIDELYNKVYSEVENIYKEMYDKLKSEENEIIDKLKNEVTKMKEKLENFLSETNKSISSNEKINKGIKILENEHKDNIISVLSYVSKINKFNKNNKGLSEGLVMNLNVSFNKKNNNIIYNEYYFNGVQTIKNIEINDIKVNNFEVVFDINNDINFDNKQIKYKIELKKENENNIQIYESENNKYIIQNLMPNTTYEIRICSVYNNINDPWSATTKIKTIDYNLSIILEESNRKNEFLEKIFEWARCKKMELIYRGTRDGSASDIFHKKCDNQGPKICLYKNEKNHIFGGYASISWTNSGGKKSAKESFLFTLTNIHDIKPTKFENSSFDNSVYHREDLGPTFSSNDIVIYRDFLNSNSWASFPSHYKDTSDKGNSIFTSDLNNENTDFKIKEIEVFKVYK